MKNAAIEQMPSWPNVSKRQKNNLEKKKGSDAQTIFDTEIDAIRNFHIHTPSRDATPAIPETGGNNNPPPPLPPRNTKETPQEHNNKFNYIEYYLNVMQCLGGGNPENRKLANTITDKQIGLVQQAAPLGRSQITLAKRPPKRGLRAFDGEIKSEFASWKQEVETHFLYYDNEFNREVDKISCVEGVLKDKALRWHQARVRQLVKLNVRDHWAAYWQAADMHFKNRHEITEKSRKLRKLHYTGDVSDYLVNLKDLNQVVAAADQAFRDQVEAPLPDDIITMMYMLGPIPEDDDDFLQVVETAGKRVEEYKRRQKERTSGGNKTK
jgi:hypothetical protein